MSAIATSRFAVPGVELIDAEFGLPARSVPLEIPLLSGDRAVLIDSGVANTPSTRISPALEVRGRPISGVELVVNTHAHDDHLGGNAELRLLAPDVTFAIHRRDVTWAQDHVAHFNQMYLSMPGQWDPSPEAEASHYQRCGATVAVDQHLEHGDVIEVGRGLDLVVIETPAHSPGHIALYNEHHGILFTGDALQVGGVPVQGAATIMPYYGDVDDYLATLSRISELEPAFLVTSHFGVITRHRIADVLDRCREFVSELDRALLAVLGRRCRPLQLKEIVAKLQIEAPAWTPGLGLHETTHAHLRRLASRKDVRAEAQDDLIHWSRTP